jgi:hypothetical protein
MGNELSAEAPYQGHEEATVNDFNFGSDQEPFFAPEVVCLLLSFIHFTSEW